MAINRIRSAALTMLLLSSASGHAIPAKPGLTGISLSDGKVLDARPTGGGNCLNYLSADDYLLVEYRAASHRSDIYAPDGRIKRKLNIYKTIHFYSFI